MSYIGCSYENYRYIRCVKCKKWIELLINRKNWRKALCEHCWKYYCKNTSSKEFFNFIYDL